MIKRKNVSDKIKLASGIATINWYLANSLPDVSLITQSSAYCFYNNKFAIVKQKGKDEWSIPGGHLEPNESPKETVIREVYEEAYLSISEPKLFGFQKYTRADRSVFYQIRWFALVNKILDFKAEYETERVEFVLPEEVGNYLLWWNTSKAGVAELQDALLIYKESIGGYE